jgi:hypothetical protein
MSRSTDLALSILAPLLIASFVGCGSGTEGPPPAAPGPSDRPKAPIEIVELVPITIGVGQSADVRIPFAVVADAEDLTMEVRPADGLAVDSPQTLFPYGARPARTALAETVAVRPTREGRMLLHVYVTGVFQGRRLGRTSVVRIQTSPDLDTAPRDPPGVIRIDPDGTRVLEQPLDRAGR